jgi:hypothetical protein
MGSSQSSTTTVSELASVISQNVTNIMMQTQNNSSSLCNSNQSQPIMITNLTNCNITASQSADVTCNMSAVFSTQNNADLSTIINDAITQAGNSSSQAVMDTLSAPMSNQSTNTKVDVKSYIQNLISTNLSTQTKNACISQAAITHGQPFIVQNCVGSTVNLSQYAQLSNVASCIGNSINSILTSDEMLNQTVNNAQSTSSTSMQGLGTVLDNAISALQSLGLSAIGATALVFIGIIFLVAVVGYFLYKILLSPAGQQAITTGAQAGASIAEKKAGGGGGMASLGK